MVFADMFKYCRLLHMVMMKNINLKTKLLVVLLSVGIIPMAISGFIVLQKVNNALELRAFSQLESVRANKTEQVEDYFSIIEKQLLTFSNSIMISDAMNEFTYAFNHEAMNNSAPEQLEKYKEKVYSYYYNDFSNEYENRNGRKINVEPILPKSNEALYHQYQYIANSEHALGEKHLLNKAEGTGLYGVSHEKYHPTIKQYLEEFGFYDIFLVEPENGKIVYSVFKELDYATSLETGPYSETNIGKAYRAAKQSKDLSTVVVEDFDTYLPSYDASASFMASPIMQYGELMGVLIFQMPVDKINAIMMSSQGLGDSGQSYLLGPDNLMRSQSRLTDDTTLLTKLVDTDGAINVNANKVGIDIFTGYNGNSVLSAYSPLAIEGLDWSIMSEIDKSEAYSAIDEIGFLLLELAVVVVLIVLALTYFMTRSISKQLGSDPNELLSIAKDIENGNFDREETHSDKEYHGVYRAMLKMQDTLKESIETEKQKSSRTERLKQALDNVSSVVMVADADLNIIYTNNIANEYFSSIESDVKLDIPSFDAKKLIGTNIDSFHKNPSHQREMLSKLMSTFESEVELGGHIMKLNVSPILSDDDRLGTVLEWTDLTAERSIEQQVQGIVDASLDGDLSQRLNLSDKSGFLLRLSEGINNMVDVSENMINDTIRVLNAVSHGDLNEKIEAEYKGTFNQLKTDVNNTIHKLTDIMKNIKESSALVSNAADEISRGNMDLSQRTESQAASLEQTSSSMEEMTSSVKQNADNSKHANELAIGAREQAQKSGEVVGEAVNAMDKINDASNKIAEITSVIDEIAFQTNLLALNAAVEAARAGEQGRGFAVVASEVRNLAGRSATAAKEIKDLIEDSVDKVEEGSRLVNQSGKTLEEIINSIKKVTEIVGDISYASNEQANGIEQVNKAIINMDETTQNNAALVEQAAAAAESMNEQSNELMRQVSFFDFDENESDEKLLMSMPTVSDKNSKSERLPIKKAAGDDFANDNWEEF